MSMKTIRRIASRVLGVGENKVRFKPDQSDKIAEALTSDDVRALASSGAIYVVPTRGVSRARGRENAEKKRVGRRRGEGTRKGTPRSRKSDKEKWMEALRAQRQLLKKLRLAGRVNDDAYRKVYNRIKGGAFKSKATLYAHMKEHGWVKDAPAKKGASAPAANVAGSA